MLAVVPVLGLFLVAHQSEVLLERGGELVQKRLIDAFQLLEAQVL